MHLHLVAILTESNDKIWWLIKLNNTASDWTWSLKLTKPNLLLPVGVLVSPYALNSLFSHVLSANQSCAYNLSTT